MWGKGPLTPLEQPDYVPAHPPVGGLVPSVVEKWGPRSQRRWFDRFRRSLDWSLSGTWRERLHTHSELHTGPCCPSCEEETLDGTGDYPYDGKCCHYAERD